MTNTEIRHGHLFCGIGAGVKGFNRTWPSVGSMTGVFRCIGGIGGRSERSMTCTRLSWRGFSGIICTTPDFKPGDQAPDGYLAWHEWAEVQHKAGLRQKECGRCGKWKYPQELSGQIDQYEAKSRKGPVTVETAVCLNCAAEGPNEC